MSVLAGFATVLLLALACAGGGRALLRILGLADKLELRLGHPVAFVLGYSYFLVITSLSTVLQQHVDNAVRGRVMALWIMGFGGAVGVGALAWGPVAHRSIGALLVIGAVWAVVLAGVCAPARLRSEVGV